MVKKGQFNSLKSLLEKNSSGSVRASKAKYFGQDTFDFFSLIEIWPKIVGEKLGKFTIPLKNHNGNLTVLTNHSAFSQQLGFLEEDIKKKIFSQFPSLKGKINRIYFNYNTEHFNTQVTLSEKMISKKTNANQEKEKIIFHKYSPTYKKLKSQADLLLQDIEDEEIRESLSSIYIQLKSE
ncbi:hypothetical protein BIY24_13100 [Halobacteriovorax marinus]|uniref:DUF721 domain-containing protein n=1 Tax=Halobacteriovorax marinus (strain ATCC BAA-682 / DSM 15412 / SJ) TaxID=862908 RepID=E1WXZ7_HALMS|nr:DUF721 domain-containing protein [Halobacteriovorax marinus]ATH08850.1 hypothetical protein BIY24_13100 [Halobacteriovorax marinus]CBW27552.1 hypothetical protein BMS_2776 [Halobacteriovorax marinus SJ]